MAFSLDDIPRELFHMIFEYLWANEIFHSFYNMSPFIDGVLYSYKNYYIDFRHLHKKTYDRLLLDFKDKIKCLVISNDISVPNFASIKNFATDLRSSEFTQLKKLALIDIDTNSILFILRYVSSFSNLKCLKLDKLPSHTGSSFNDVLSKITRLDLPDATFFDKLSEDSIRNLKCLSVVDCTFPQLQHLFNILSRQTFKAFALTNGTISTMGDNHWPQFCRVPNHLKRLNLQIDFQSITFNEIKGLLLQLPRLTYLNIKGEGDIDLADGQQWEVFLHKTYGNQLIVFDFCFTIWSYVNMNTNVILEAFCRPYWLNRIRPWYVAYNDRGLIYTIPHYISICCRSDEILTCRTTTNDERIFFNAINQLVIHNPTTIPVYRFDHVDFLRISNDAYDPTVDNISLIVNLSRIKHLEISTTIPHNLLNSMSNLYHLSLTNINSLLLSLDQIGLHLKFNQIHVLDINYNPTDHRSSDVPPETLYPMFPNVVKLSMSGIPIRRSYLNRVIDGFHQMIYGKFQIDWNQQQRENAGKDFERETGRLISNTDQTNFSFHFEPSYLHLFIWDTQQ